jgi:hypothetical protein
MAGGMKIRTLWDIARLRSAISQKALIFALFLHVHNSDLLVISIYLHSAPVFKAVLYSGDDMNINLSLLRLYFQTKHHASV